MRNVVEGQDHVSEPGAEEACEDNEGVEGELPINQCLVRYAFRERIRTTGTISVWTVSLVGISPRYRARYNCGDTKLVRRWPWSYICTEERDSVRKKVEGVLRLFAGRASL